MDCFNTVPFRPVAAYNAFKWLATIHPFMHTQTGPVNHARQQPSHQHQLGIGVLHMDPRKQQELGIKQVRQPEELLYFESWPPPSQQQPRQHSSGWDDHASTVRPVFMGQGWCRVTIADPFNTRSRLHNTCIQTRACKRQYFQTRICFGFTWILKIHRHVHLYIHT